MPAVCRPALREDASRLHDIRRRSILELAPAEMSGAEVQAWAERLTLDRMARKLRELEVWVVECEGVVAGWGAVRGGRLEGLYIAAECAGQGIGAGLLDRLERLIFERGFPLVHLEASANARGFYLRFGYRAIGPRTPQGAWPMVKRQIG